MVLKQPQKVIREIYACVLLYSIIRNCSRIDAGGGPEFEKHNYKLKWPNAR